MADAAPRPVPDADSAPFWEGAAAGRLRLQYGPESGRWQFPPLERDRFTGGPLEWRDVGGGGVVHSFIVQRQAAAPGFSEVLPYVIALVELDEAPGVRLPARLLDAVGRARVGARVACEFVRQGDLQLPVFRLVEP
jgi:uncharacterized OB-fold protein